MVKFTVSSKQLLFRLASVDKVINTKNLTVAQGTFFMSVTGNELLIAGTDSENMITTTIALTQVEGEGSFCLDHKKLLDIAKAMPECDITITANDDHVVEIKYSKGSYKLTAIEGEMFPRMNFDESDAQTLTLTQSSMAKGLDAVSFASDTNTLRPQLMGVYFDIKENAVVYAATNGAVLSKYRNTQTQHDITGSFILPTKSVGLLRYLLNKTASVDLSFTSKAARFSCGAFQLYSLCVNGKFPNYERVINLTPEYKLASIDRVEIQEALKRISLCADVAQKLIRMSFNAGGIKASSRDMGTSVTEQIQGTYEGEDMEIGMNVTNFSDAIGVVTSEKVNLRITEPGKPVYVLPSENDEFGELVILCMPLRLNDEQ